jgi:hypothetical protein
MGGLRGVDVDVDDDAKVAAIITWHGSIWARACAAARQ